MDFPYFWCFLVLFLFPKWKRLYPSKKDSFIFSFLVMNVCDFAVKWCDFRSDEKKKRPRDESNTLYVTYHSRCSLDLFLIVSQLRPTVLLSHLGFRVPVVSSLLRALGAIPSTSDVFPDAEATFINHLVSDKPVFLVPGGTHEFSKPVKEKYKVKWHEVPGFARVICKHKLNAVKVVPIFTANCESVFPTTDAWYDATSWRLRATLMDIREGKVHKIPYFWLLVLLSLGNVFLPQRVRMGLCFGEPIRLRDGEDAAAFARRVKAELESLIENTQGSEVYTNADSGEPQQATSLILPHHWLFTRLYTIFQNLLLVIVIVASVAIAIVPAYISSMLMPTRKERKSKSL